MSIPSDTPERLLKINDVVTRLGVSRRTVYSWIRMGKVQFVRIPNGSIRIIESSLTAKGTSEGGIVH